MPTLFGVIMHHQMATRHELETIYNFTDALDMLEIITVHHYNEWWNMETMRHGR